MSPTAPKCTFQLLTSFMSVSKFCLQSYVLELQQILLLRRRRVLVRMGDAFETVPVTFPALRLCYGPHRKAPLLRTMNEFRCYRGCRRRQLSSLGWGFRQPLLLCKFFTVDTLEDRLRRMAALVEIVTMTGPTLLR